MAPVLICRHELIWGRVHILYLKHISSLGSVHMAKLLQMFYKCKAEIHKFNKKKKVGTEAL